ncbi:receptor-type tyrosine-protein phosphatase F [Aplysia californica]|uniref:Receptor-type tyrosine-protein phosphatase F n=1 Tax=Aplysia californica TaxID=6500 RepID=A0ABM1A234_APLCA|nr:receptor-type tyrosine-protein phosphatase F [Aplysia californica]
MLASTCFTHIACILALVLALHTCLAQTPCSLTNCARNFYCAEKVDGSTECLPCNSACEGCEGPTELSCLACKIGYYIPPGSERLCQACPDGKFGVDCALQCHCLNNVLCNKTNGHCSGWKCERGYTGIPECQTLCPVGTFGLDCQGVCHCPENDNCSHVNGDCSSGQCHPDWDSSGCQLRLPKLALGPDVTEASCNRIRLEWDEFNETNDIGTGPAGQYVVYKKVNNSSAPNTLWERLEALSVVTGLSRYTYVVTRSLEPDEEYNFRVDVVGTSDGKLRRKVSPGNPSEIVLNPCTSTTTPKPPTTTQFLFSRKVFDTIEATASSTKSGYVTIRWTVLPQYQQLNYDVTITRQLLGNGDCDKDGTAPETFGPFSITDSPIAFEDMVEWGSYRFQVAAVSQVMDVRETAALEATTKPVAPTGQVTVLNVTRVTDTEVELAWDPPPCGQRKGPFVSYEFTLSNLNITGLGPVMYYVNEARIQRANLEPYSTYAVTLKFVNTESPGPLSKVFTFSTMQGVPTSVEITSLSMTYSTITADFLPPSQANGIVLTFTLVYSEFSDFQVSEAVTRSAQSAVNTITARRLKPETLYYVKMTASTEAGPGPYGAVKQTTTLTAPPPAEAIALNLGSRTTECLTIEWTPPETGAENITQYILEMRRATAEETIKPTPLTLDSSVTTYQQCDLRPSSLYLVTISADTADGVISTATETFRTEHGVPPRPAVVEFVRSDYTNVTVAIQPVVSPFVPITSYQLQVQKVSSPARRRRFVGVPGVVVAELSPADVTERREFIVGDGQTYGSYTNDNLERESYYMIYYVALSTLNNQTTANFSQLEAAVRTVPFDPALAPPLTLEVSGKSTACLNITWEIPKGLEAIITQLRLSVERLGEDSGDSKLVTLTELDATSREFSSCSLSPYTLYTMRLSALSDSTVLSTGSDTFRTGHVRPRTPVAPVFVNSSYTSLTVAIEPVVLSGGPVTAYQIQVEKVPERRKRSAIFPFMSWERVTAKEQNHGLSRDKRAAGVPGTVVAQLTKEQVPQKMDFTVGDGLSWGGYNNSALEREALYTVHYVVVSAVGNDTKVSYASLDPPRRTVPYIPPAPPQLQSSDDDNGALIGIIVALILLVIIILLLLLLYWWWQRRNRFNPYAIQEDDPSKIALPPYKDDYDPELYWSHTYDLKGKRHIIAGRDLVYAPGSKPFVNAETMDDLGIPKVSFKNEFQSLPHKPRRATDNAARRNKRLNRFPHLLPYDHSLVQLRPDSNSDSTYINASFIPGYNKTPAYIAAQSPFDDRTVLDFWRLIYQRSIKTVVMITNVVEDEIVKCTQYWPDQTKTSYGNFLFQLVDQSEFADYIVRTISVTLLGEENSKIVKLFEFTSWPDHGVPDDPIPLLEMRYKVRRYHHQDPGPILVHCGTGVARTGVFIAVDALIEQYANEGQVMTFDFVRKIRKDRPYMVRTLKQYVFIYEALFEEFHAGDTLIDFDLKERYHNWTQRNPRTNCTYLRDQFQLLDSFTRGPRRDECKAGLLEVNIQKNRYLDVLPAEKHRPILISPGGLNPTDYINALFVDGYLRKNQFIITQTPLHTTIIDFWKLIYDHDVRTIVMVENFKNEDDTCAEYWPSVNLKQFEPFFIETTAVYQQDNITIRNFKICSTDHPSRPGKLVRQFQFNAWEQPNLTPQSKTLMLDLMDMVFNWQEESCKNERPVVVHCQDGSSHSGLFAILSIICEKMEEDEEVDVYRTIKHIKRRRPQFIADYGQFRFCYKSVWDFMNLRMPGGTFTDSLGQTKMDKMYGVASLSLNSYLGTRFDTINLQDTTEF